MYKLSLFFINSLFFKRFSTMCFKISTKANQVLELVETDHMMKQYDFVVTERNPLKVCLFVKEK